MNWFLFYIFTAIAISMALPALWRKEYRLQFPCLAGLTVLFQVSLPLATLNSHPSILAPELLTRFSIIAILGLTAAWVGYGWWRPSPTMFMPRFNQKKLLAAAVLLVLFGLFYTWKTANTTPDIDPVTGNWTGSITIYGTLASVMRYGAMLGAILYFRTKDRRILILVLPQVFQYFELFLIGRRSPTGEAAIVICVLFFLYRKWSPPAWLLGLGIFAMALFCFNIGIIRNTVDLPLSERMKAFAIADPVQSITIQEMKEDRGYVEIYNGANFMEGTSVTGHYNYGLHFWNRLVFGFVPAQIVGADVKKGLMFDLPDDTEKIGFDKSVGTCETGLGEAFMAYGYFGCWMFFAMGAFMRWIWEGSVRGSLLHQLLLMLCMLPSVLSFSLELFTFINLLVNLAIFAGPLLYWSRIPIPTMRCCRFNFASPRPTPAP